MTRALRIIVSVGGIACLALAAWAVLPLVRPAEQGRNPLQDGAEQTRSIPSHSNHTANSNATKKTWATPLLWNPPPPPPKAEAAPEPAKEPDANLELIAIVMDGGIRRAALYDKDNDRLHVVGQEESIGRYTVIEVDARRVKLSDGARTLTLAIQDPDGQQDG